jgi:hypothetical protein
LQQRIRAHRRAVNHFDIAACCAGYLRNASQPFSDCE